MSNFNLKLAYPEVDYDIYQTNIDGTPKCPGYWNLTQLSAISNRYVERAAGYWTVRLDQGEYIDIPFKCNEVSLLNKHTFEFSHFTYSESGDNVSYSVKVWFNETDYQEINLGLANREFTLEVDIPDYASYIRIEPDIENASWFLLFTNIDIDMKTSDIGLATELNDISITNYDVTTLSVGNTLHTTKVKDYDVDYTNEIALENNLEQEVEQITRLSRLVDIRLDMYINYTELAGYTPGGIPSGGLENIVRYFYLDHVSYKKSGLQSYINIQYRNDNNNNLSI